MRTPRDRAMALFAEAHKYQALADLLIAQAGAILEHETEGRVSPMRKTILKKAIREVHRESELARRAA